MNLNPFAVQAPDSVECILENASASCARFNSGKGVFVGQYMAIGRTDGSVAVYNVETKGVLRKLDGHVKSVTSVSWSPYNRYLASSSLDWNVVIWDLGSGRGEMARKLRFAYPISSVQFCPTHSKILVVVLESQQAILVDLRRHQGRPAVHTNGASTSNHNEQQRDSIHETRHELNLVKDNEGEARSAAILSAAFTPDGRRIVAGTSKGDLLVFDRATRRVIQRFHAGSSGVRQLAVDRSGRTIVTNSNDRVVRLFTLTTKHEDGGNTSMEISPLHRFQDLVNRTPWLGIGFSGDGEYVFGGAAHKVAHNIYIWDRGAGVLDKILQGPRDSLVDVDWHPTRPMLASVSNTGAVNIWFTPPTEIYSAYAPDFEELEENIEYEEREDEFDLEDEEELTRRKQDEEEAFVEIRPAPRRVSQHLMEGGDGIAMNNGGGSGGASDGGHDGDDDDDDDDDDNDEAFIIAVRLSLDVGMLEGED